jgi:hypothetical protein
MTSIAPITAELKSAPAAKPKDQSVYIRAKYCEAKVVQRVKFYDTECAGFYVSVTPNGAATFNFRYTDRNTKKQRTVWLGVYEATEFPVEGPFMGVEPTSHGPPIWLRMTRIGPWSSRQSNSNLIGGSAKRGTP